MADISLFPGDLFSNILSRLPIKYVLRSRSVCKKWNSMLRSPDFFSFYYKHQSSIQERLAKDGISSFIVLEYVKNASEYDPAHVLLSFLTLKKMGNELITTTVDKVEKFDILTSPSLESLSTRDRIHGDHVCFANVYDGIICLGTYVGVVLYNPYTRESQRLPFPVGSTPYLDNVDHIILGMWFESNQQQPGTINHYKVFGLVNLNHGFGCNTYVIEKYDSAEGSWSEIKTIRNRPKQYFREKCLLFNGIFYVYVEGDSVVTLDARLEKFGLLPLPSEFTFRDFKHLCLDDLFVLGRSLALIAENRDSDRDFCQDIWIMTEYGVKESWTRAIHFSRRWFQFF
ncbi:F-box/kelch-repeat protein At3g06240-like [Impatiens glandulifera]|uniref:F-box/kelch-repeat protein At3g06240-like n=1 Tax=Impatiens glandulifera TaxID=253017 RepID=UPI001FB127BA|nr:F-box/kelch-repeat protein At3g06240-like [Impatiens glandulifera]